MAWRLAHIDKTKYYSEVVENGNNRCWNGKTHFVETQLKKPFKWKKPRMIFVCSMGDLFHESVPFVWFEKVMKVIKKCPQHTFQILTKRPEIMAWYFDAFYKMYPGLLDNIWLGVTTENQKQANKRIPILLQIPAKVRFVSVEPMLSNVDLTSIHEGDEFYTDSLHTENALDWVICGGESGHNARPIESEWPMLLKNQCQRAGVPFFFKQWNKKADGSLLDGKEYKQFPNLK